VIYEKVGDDKMRNEPCFCGSGKKAKKCHEGIEPNSAFADVIRLYKQLDSKIESEVGNIRCKKGCFSCCHQSFAVSTIEFYFVMDDYIKTYGMNKARELIDKGYEFWLQYEKAFPEQAEGLKMKKGEGVVRDFNKAYQNENNTDKVSHSLYMQAACPFLDTESGSCSVYEARPHVCRTFGVAYDKKLDVPFALCQHITDGLDYQEEMVDISELDDDINRLSVVYLDTHSQLVTDRPLPFFYFLKIQKGREESMLMKINDYKNYSLKKSTELKLERIMRNNA
jgi:Fe-S-cluster containining protein